MIHFVGAGPGGIYSVFELVKLNSDLHIAVFESGNPLEKRKCPIDGDKVKSCISCPTCSIMSGFGGAGAFSDGKYNITNAFGGTLYEHIGREKAIELMKYVDDINMARGGEGTRLYSTKDSELKKKCIQNELSLLDASVRHLGTDKNYIVLGNLYNELKDKVDFYFNTPVEHVVRLDDGSYKLVYNQDQGECNGKYCIISAGRSGSKWMQQVCKEMDIESLSDRVDIGVRVELPARLYIAPINSRIQLEHFV